MPDLLRALYRVFPHRLVEDRMRGGAALVFAAEPLVLYVFDWVLAELPGALLPVFRRYRYRPVHLLVELSWARDDAWNVDQLSRWKTEHQQRHPNHRMHFLANAEAEHRMMTARGLGSAWVSHNAFADPEVFRPLPDRPKRFDAVYDARVCPFKRHELAAGVRSLSLVTSKVDRFHDEAYVRSVRGLLPGAHWCNDPLDPGWRSLSGPEINEAINEARVGLCLSAVEGAMFASVQYLLAGLPVVSTASRGGRDAFFDPACARIVADDPAAVAEGVREMSSCPLPPGEIRRRTLERIAAHRDRLFELLDAIAFAEGTPRVPRSRWSAWTAPTRIADVDPGEIFRRIEEARRG